MVLSYLQSSDMRSDLSADLKAVQEDLQVKYGNNSPLLARKHANENIGDETSICRKPSVGYMEENYATGRYENIDLCISIHINIIFVSYYLHLSFKGQAIAI